ncbi:hypothetical protein [Priestia aryabhattai]
MVSSNITGTVTIENRVYHLASSSLDMVIKMDQTDKEEVSFVAQEKVNSNIKLSIYSLCEDDGYYVVRVNNLSPSWEALASDPYQENEGGKGIINKQEYALLANDLGKQFVNKKLKNYDKAIAVEVKHKR